MAKTVSLVRKGTQLQPCDRRRGRARSGGDDETAGADPYPLPLDFARADEARVRPQHRDAELLEALLGIVRRDAGDDRIDPRDDLVEVDALDPGSDAEAAGATDELGGAGRGDQRLRRDATVVEALAAHLAPFEQDDLRSELRRAGGDGKPRRSAADDAKVCFEHAHQAVSFDRVKRW